MKGEGVEQKRTPCLQGGRGIDTSKCVRKKIPFLHVFCDIFIYEVFDHTLLPLASTFITIL